MVRATFNFLISVHLQSVEEAECRRAYNSATAAYMSSFDRTKPAEEVKAILQTCMHADVYMHIRDDILIYSESSLPLD